MEKPKRKRRTKAEMEEARKGDLKLDNLKPIPTIGVEVENVPQVKFGSVEGISVDGYLEGWVTINHAPKTRYAREWFYCGGDIYDTEEKAKKVTANNRVGVAKIKVKVR